MSVDKQALTRHPFGKVTQWGCPWHGLVQSGTLTLPNAATRPHPQPDYLWRDTAGVCHRIKVPGVAPIARSTEQLAADAAAGRQWRDEAMLSGGRFQIYGLELDGWIYVDPAGDRWRVSCPDLHHQMHDVTAPFSGTLTLRRFGAIGAGGAEPEIYEYPVSISDWGQSDPCDPVWEGMDTAAATDHHFRTMFDAIAPDGSKALLMVHVYQDVALYPGHSDYIDPMLRWPMGWLELSISGPGADAAVGFSVARTRAQTMSIERTVFGWGPERRGGVYIVSEFSTDLEVWEGLASDTPPENYQSNFVRWTVAVGEMSYSESRLLALWYADDGSHRELRFQYDWSGIMNFPEAEMSGGGYDYAWTRDVSCTSTWTVKLVRDSSILDSVEGTYAYSCAEGFEVHAFIEFDTLFQQDRLYQDWTILSPAFVAASVSMGDISGTFTHDFTKDYGEDAGDVRLGTTCFATFAPMGLFRGNIHPDRNFPASDVHGLFRNLAPPYALAGNPLAIQPTPPDWTAAQKPAWAFFAPLWRFITDTDELRCDIVRQSSQVIGMRTFAASSSQWTYRPAATPGGAYGTPTVRPYTSSGESLYASHDPATGQTSWLNTTPVCWV